MCFKIEKLFSTAEEVVDSFPGGYMLEGVSHFVNGKECEKCRFSQFLPSGKFFVVQIVFEIEWDDIKERLPDTVAAVSIQYLHTVINDISYRRKTFSVPYFSLKPCPSVAYVVHVELQPVDVVVPCHWVKFVELPFFPLLPWIDRDELILRWTMSTHFHSTVMQ